MQHNLISANVASPEQHVLRSHWLPMTMIYLCTRSDVGMHVVCRAIHSRRHSSELDVAFHADPLPDALKGTGRGANKHASWFICVVPGGGSLIQVLTVAPLRGDGSRFRVKWIQRHNKQMKDDASSLRGSGVDFKGFVRQIRLHAHETSTNHGKVQWIHHFVTNGRSQKPESE